MRLPRYTKARSAVAELASRPSISPQEAANFQLAKAGAISAGLTALSDVAGGIAEIAAEEEYTDAITTWQSAVNAFDEGLDSMPLDKNEIGEHIYDADLMRDREIEGRRKITSDVRSAIKSTAARIEFDKQIALAKPDRDAQVAARFQQKKAVFLEVKAIGKVQEFIQAGQYDAARAKNDSSYGTGAIGASKHADLDLVISTSEEYDYFYGITNAEVFDPQAAETAITAISQHELDGETLTLSKQQLSPIRAKILSRYASDLETQEERIQDAQYLNYLDLVDLNEEGKLTDQMLMTAARAGVIDPEKGISQADFERLQGDMGEEAAGKFSAVGDTASGFEYFSAEADEIANGPSLIPDPTDIGDLDPEYNWGQRYDKFMKNITSPDTGLSYDTRQKLKADATAARNQLLGDEQFKQIVKKGVTSVTGFEQDKITAMMSTMDSQFKDTIVVGEEFRIALTKERLRLGPGNIEELAQFEKEQTPIYKLKVNNKILTKVGVKETWPESGKIDEEFINRMADDMVVWLQGRMEKNPGTAARDVRQFKSTVEELERLNGIDIRSYMTIEEQAMVY